MKTVKVKMLSDEVNRAGDPLEKDSIQELTEDSAQYWIKRGKAELVKDEPKGKAVAQKPADEAAAKTAAEEQRVADEAAARVTAEAEATRLADEAAAADRRTKDEAAAKAAKGGQGTSGTGAAPK